MRPESETQIQDYQTIDRTFKLSKELLEEYAKASTPEQLSLNLFFEGKGNPPARFERFFPLVYRLPRVSSIDLLDILEILAKERDSELRRSISNCLDPV